MIATFAMAAPASAQEKTATAGNGTIQVSCWVNVFAWVSTSPSVQGNLSSSFPRTLWGEVRGTVTEYSGFVSSGSWGTQALSC